MEIHKAWVSQTCGTCGYTGTRSDPGQAQICTKLFARAFNTVSDSDPACYHWTPDYYHYINEKGEVCTKER